MVFLAGAAMLGFHLFTLYGHYTSYSVATEITVSDISCQWCTSNRFFNAKFYDFDSVPIKYSLYY